MRRLLDAIGLGRTEGPDSQPDTQPDSQLGGSGPEQVIAHRYRLLESLGPCGVGERFTADDEVTEERVLVLVLPASFGGPQTAARLVRLDVAHGDARILRPTASGVDDRGRPYIVTRWVDGEPLSTILARGTPPWSRTFALFEQLSDMLAVAHKRALWHGSLEPSRILVGDGGPWLLDYGLANALARSNKGGFSQPGSPEYVAPELFAGRSPSALADLYSLGIILWETVAGAPPFCGSLSEVVEGHRSRAVPEVVRRGDAPVEVEALLGVWI